jgi:hypothetical protein
MTVNQTLGPVSTTVNLDKAKAKVKEVEDSFAAVKAMIQAIVTYRSKPGMSDEWIRDNAIVLAMNIDLDFRLAVSQKLVAAFRAGELS